MFRNVFTAFGAVCVVAVFFFFIRPDWIKQVSSSPAQPQGTTHKVNARLAGDRLTSREVEVLVMMARGRTNTEIVGDICVSEPSVLILNS